MSHIFLKAEISIRDELRYPSLRLRFQDTDTVDVQKSPVKCSTLTICWVGSRAAVSQRTDRGAAEGEGETETKPRPTRKKGQIQLDVKDSLTQKSLIFDI